jgi:tetratricopeptide (TPR) repeat protein
MIAALFRWRDAGTNPSWPAWIKKPIGMGFVALVVLLSVLTMMRNPAWYDSYTLYATDIKKSPESVKLRYHYALETGKKAVDTEDSTAKNALLTEALKDLEKVISMHPTYWEAHGTAGLYAYRKGDREAAMTYYQKATELNPNAAIAWSNMGIIYAERGDLDQAQGVYEKSVAADPRFVDAWMNLGAIKAQKGDFAGAIDAFMRGLQFDPENVRLLTMLGSAYKDSGQPEMGQPYLDKANRMKKE